MKTINEVSKLTGLSVRTIQYYDKIGLLKPSSRTPSGYRLYDDVALEKLRQIMLFRSLEIPLKDIAKIVNETSFDGKEAINRQIEILKRKRDQLDALINFAIGIKLIGGKFMDFSAFDKTKLDDYAKQAKERWSGTDAYKEFLEHSKNRTESDDARLAEETMSLFTEFGAMRMRDPADSEVQAQVKKLQDFFTKNFYNCTDNLLLGLGKMYAGGGEFTDSIDNTAGKGTAEFVYKAITIYCSHNNVI